MYEYGIYNGANTTIIFGYNYQDACRRAGLNPLEWAIEYQEYVD